MKYYILVEGKVEKIVYRKWIPFINNDLIYFDFKNIESVPDNGFVIVNGGGNPYYYSMVQDSILDVINYNFDELVLIIDTEDLDEIQKNNELNKEIQIINTSVKISIILQNPCIEAWALGNRKVFKRNPINPILREFISQFNVCEEDPELLPSNTKYNYNRATFAYEYLRKVLQEKNGSYSKTKPQIITERYYFDQIHSRYARLNHIQQFRSFLDVFSKN